MKIINLYTGLLIKRNYLLSSNDSSFQNFLLKIGLKKTLYDLDHRAKKLAINIFDPIYSLRTINILNQHIYKDLIESNKINNTNLILSHLDIKYINSTSKLTQYLESVLFIHSNRNHHETQQKQAKSGPEAGFGVNVELAFDDNFEIIIKASKPTFVMFYASWCTHCVQAKPAFSKLATHYKQSSKVRIVAVEASENPKVADLAGIETLPTFKIFKNGKILALYEGDRSIDDMLKFCQTYEK